MKASDFRRVDAADVYRRRYLVGQLRRTEDGTEFQYARSFLEERPFGSEGVAWRMPPTDLPYFGKGESLPPFFANLAPEGARLAATIGRLHTSPDDLMTVLLAIGRDCVGDVQVVPTGSGLDEFEPSVPPSIENVDLEELFWEAVGGEKLDRSSIAGVQDKASGSVVSFPAKLGFGKEPTIIKISPKAFPLLVENEAFFLGLARKAKIKVNDWRLVRDRTGRQGLVIKRFDRLKKGRRVELVHQEDMCQLLERYPWQKYRIGMREIADAVVELSSSPRAEFVRLIELYCFSYLIGNADLHAKNVSMYRRGDVIELTPGYDLLSTLPYSQLDTRMAIALNGKEDQFKLRTFLEFGERYGVPEAAVRLRVEEIASAVESGVKEFSSIGYGTKTDTRFASVVEERLRRLGL